MNHLLPVPGMRLPAHPGTRPRRLRSRTVAACVTFVVVCGPLALTAPPGVSRPAGISVDTRLLAQQVTGMGPTPIGYTAPEPNSATALFDASLPAADGSAPAPDLASTLAAAPGPVSDPTTWAARTIGPTPVTTAPPTSAAMTAITFALAQIGLPYVWGGNGPAAGHAGFDCSGLTTAAYAAAGIRLPRTAHTQYLAGPRLAPGAELQPGDLVFYGVPSKVHHVGLYLGDGVMVNAPRFGKPVQLAYYRWRGDDYLGASRPSVGPALPSIPLLAYGLVEARTPSAGTGFVAPRVPEGAAPPIAQDPAAGPGPDPFGDVPLSGTPSTPGVELPVLPEPDPVPLPDDAAGEAPVPDPAVVIPPVVEEPVTEPPEGTGPDGSAPGTEPPPATEPPVETPPGTTPPPTTSPPAEEPADEPTAEPVPPATTEPPAEEPPVTQPVVEERPVTPAPTTEPAADPTAATTAGGAALGSGTP